MKLDKKGLTLVEIIVSISLISLVLIFLMGLFINIRGTYNRSKIQSDYEILNATIIRAIGDDIENYGLYSVDYLDSTKSAVVLTYDEFRPTKLSERIKKVLRVYFDKDKYFISYAYESGSSHGATSTSITEHLTPEERVTSVIRPVPNDVILNSSEYITLEKKSVTTGETIIRLKLPLANENGNAYDINICGVIYR